MPTNPEKGNTEKLRIIYAYRPSGASTVDKNMHERMTLEKPWIGL